MKKQAAHRPLTLRFRRWSRKGYAAFCSLQRTVTIGCLRIGICEQSLSKNCVLHASATRTATTNCSEDEEENGCLQHLRQTDTERLLLALGLLPITTAKRTAAAAGRTATSFHT
ncbi:MAG: hypothetical protein RR382_06045 [Tannerellaceae bacterium]